jgi:hypothetical protein
MNSITTATEIIDALGGNIPVARLTSATAKTVSSWRGRNRFPANTYPVLQSELVRLGFSAPAHLWRMRLPVVGKVRRNRTA